MQDQARNLKSRGIAVDYMSSSQTAAEQAAILKKLQAGKLALQLLLTTPESFGTDRHALLLPAVICKLIQMSPGKFFSGLFVSSRCALQAAQYPADGVCQGQSGAPGCGRGALHQLLGA